jgi:hypothetical protein
VAFIAATEERDAALELSEETHEFLGHGRDGALVAFGSLIRFPDREAVFGMEISAPEDVIS